MFSDIVQTYSRFTKLKVCKYQWIGAKCTYQKYAEVSGKCTSSMMPAFIISLLISIMV